MYIYIYIHTHTYTHIHTYTCIYVLPAARDVRDLLRGARAEVHVVVGEVDLRAEELKTLLRTY